MFENENTAQTNDTEVSGAVADAGDGNVTEESLADFTDSSGEKSDGAADAGNEGGAEAKTESEDEKAKQKAQNSESARRRRDYEKRLEAERVRELDAAKTEARNNAIISALDGINPYTKEPMKDARDVEEYLTMKEIAKTGKDPVSDFARYHKEKEREKEAAATAEAEKKAWYKEDQAKFEAAHPDVKLSELAQDKTFLSFAAGKVGKVPLNDIYAEYVDAKNAFINEYKTQSAKEHANKKASPGALGGEGSDKTRFTLEQMQGMSREEVRKNWPAIEESLKYI